MTLEEAMKLLWVAVYKTGDGGALSPVYEGPLDKAPGPIQRAFALDSRYDHPAKVAAMWVVRHAVQLPPYLVVADPADGADLGDLLQALNLERVRHPLEDVIERLLKEEEGV